MKCLMIKCSSSCVIFQLHSHSTIHTSNGGAMGRVDFSNSSKFEVGKLGVGGRGGRGEGEF